MKTHITALALAALVAAAAFTQPAAAAADQDWNGYPLSQWYSSPTGVPPGGR